MYITNTSKGQAAQQADAPSFLAMPLSLQLTCDREWREECTGDVYAKSRELLVHDFFEVKNPDSFESSYLLLPTCFTTLMFMLSDQGSNCFMCGALTTARHIKIPPKAEIFCVQLKPGAMSGFIKHRACEFTDRVVPMSCYFSWASELLGLLHGMRIYEQRCLIALAFLTQYVEKKYHIPSEVQDALDLIHKYKGNVRVCDVCNMISKNERTMHKHFSETEGVSPKAYADIVRFLHALYTITATPIRCLGEVAKECGYVDQPHMNRAFKKHFGYTAREILFLNMHEIFVPNLLDDSKL